MRSDGSTLSLAFGRTLGRVVVEVAGALDATTAAQLRDRLVDLISGQGNRDVVLDLRGMTRVDPTGLDVLVDAQKRIQRIAGQLMLSGATPAVMDVLVAAGLDKVFTLTPSWSHPAHGDRPPAPGRAAGFGWDG